MHSSAVLRAAPSCLAGGGGPCKGLARGVQVLINACMEASCDCAHDCRVGDTWRHTCSIVCALHVRTCNVSASSAVSGCQVQVHRGICPLQSLRIYIYANYRVHCRAGCFRRACCRCSRHRTGCTTLCGATSCSCAARGAPPPTCSQGSTEQALSGAPHSAWWCARGRRWGVKLCRCVQPLQHLPWAARCLGLP